MKIEELLSKECGVKQTVGSLQTEISALTQDSRKAEKGAVFFAVRGTSVDGHSYIDTAVQQGAAAVVC
ncbi:MAG: hypothetical protein K2I83_03420 [Bacteroidales bacterium]|nr:hypothetical protein [Bacteroidales bacterium]